MSLHYHRSATESERPMLTFLQTVIYANPPKNKHPLLEIFCIAGCHPTLVGAARADKCFVEWLECLTLEDGMCANL